MMVGDGARGDAAFPNPPRGGLPRGTGPEVGVPAIGERGRELGDGWGRRVGVRRVMPGGRVRGCEGEKKRGEGERVEGLEVPDFGTILGEMTGDGMRGFVGETEVSGWASRMKEKGQTKQVVGNTAFVTVVFAPTKRSALDTSTIQPLDCADGNSFGFHVIGRS